MNHMPETASGTVAEVLHRDGQASVLLVCEHASHFIPPHLDNLGVTSDALTSHAAWDPGALAVADRMARHLDAPLVASRISRLVYDCNRPPEAMDAMPARSERIDIPGNKGLSASDRQARIDTYYKPFRRLLDQTLETHAPSALITLHSFTPVYEGVPRTVEIGLLHDTDTRLADAMMACASEHSPHKVARNAPYGPQDGVTHTLKEHALPRGIPNVMIEVRNDLIHSDAAQEEMAALLSRWVIAALNSFAESECRG